MSAISSVTSSLYSGAVADLTSSGQSERPEGPPPGARGGGASGGKPPGGGGGKVGSSVKSALEEQGLDDGTLAELRDEIEATLTNADSETSSSVLSLLEQYGVDTEQLASDLSEYSDAVPGEQSTPRVDAASAVLKALFAFDEEA